MSNSPRIILHIGGPKTGSTYIQRRLRLTPELTRSYGIHVPVLDVVERMAGNAKLLPIAIDKKAGKTFLRAFPNIDVAQLNAKSLITELLKGWRREEETLVLSAENFRIRHAKILRDLLPKEISYTVILTIRRQDEWVDSYFNQLTKSGNISEDISTFVTRICNAPEGLIASPDWLAQYQAWSEAFGHCELINFDVARSDLFNTFLSTAGIQTPNDLPDLAPTQVSIGIFQIAYLLKLRDDTPHKEFARHRGAAVEAAQRLQWMEKGSLLSTSDRLRLQDRFEAGNKRLVSEVPDFNGANLLTIEPESDRYYDLQELYRTPEYTRFHELTETLLHGRRM